MDTAGTTHTIYIGSDNPGDGAMYYENVCLPIQTYRSVTATGLIDTLIPDSTTIDFSSTVFEDSPGQDQYLVNNSVSTAVAVYKSELELTLS